MPNIDPEESARRILEATNLSVPVDVYAIARMHNIDIRIQELEDAVSGMLVIKDTYAIIVVNERHHSNRQRFTVAHELGHFTLHRNATHVFIDANPVFFRDTISAQGTHIQEMEANAFAAELLMPASFLQGQIGTQPLNPTLDPFDDVTIQQLAAKLQVSIQALTIRLTRLGLIVE